MEVAGGHLTPCMSLKAAVNLHNLLETDSGFGRVINGTISLVSLILFLTRVYIHSLPSPMDRIYVCVKFSDYGFLFFPENTLFRASPGIIRNVLLKWESPNCFGPGRARQTGPHSDPRTFDNDL